MAFDQTTRNRLARFVGDARTLLAEEFARQLQNDFGLDPSTGDVAELASLARLDDSRRETARLLRDTMEHYLAAGSSEGAKARQEVLTRIVREQAFTVLNRLCAIRMAEARGLLIDSVANGYQSKGFQLYSRLAGTALGETGDAYRCYLFSLFDELAMDLPVLFDRFSAQGRLFPRESALLALLDLINHPEIEPLWPEDETIGWVYQYFNTADERRQMRAASQAPRNSRELAVRNQFFTPRYVVEFLTDNTLGRIWYEMAQGCTSLADACRYLVRRPNEIFLAAGESPPEAEAAADDLSQEELLQQPVHITYRPLKDPRDIRMLDPACGSMHFGLYAFDLFERIYDEAWELEASGSQFVRSEGLVPLRETFGDKQAFLREVPRLIIERNIHGIDIDSRAVQIAGLSLWLRAQRSWRDQGIRALGRPPIRRSNIVCAEPMPGDEGLLDEFLQSLHEDRLESLIRRVLDIPADKKVRATPQMAESLCGLVRTVWKEMEIAGEAGSLLKIDEALADAVAAGREEWEEKAPLFRVTEFGLDQDSPRTRYLKFIPGAMDDFWTRAEALVLAALEAYAEQSINGGGYQRRLFADDAARGFAFVDIGRKRYDVVLMNPPFGEAAKESKRYVDRQYEHSTADVLQAFVERGLALLSPLGREGVISARTGFFLGASKDWRSEVVFKNRVVCFADLGLGVLDDALVEVATYVVERGDPVGNRVLTNRQLDTREKAGRLLNAIEATRQAEEGGFRAFDQSLVELIPDYTFAYWAPARLLRRYSKHSSFGTVVGKVRQGIATADDFRFARLGWEVGNESIGVSARWQRFSKGGEYAPPYDDIHLLIDWLKQGGQLAASPSARFQNVEKMFNPGATYTVRTASAFAGKILPAGCIFSHNAQTWFTDSTDFTLLSIGFLSCRVPQAFLELAVGSGDIATAGSAARRYTTAVVESVPSALLLNDTVSKNLDAVRSLYGLRLTELMRDETSCHFGSFHLRRGIGNLRQAVHSETLSHVNAVVETLNESARLDKAVTDAFHLTADEASFVDEEVGVHPTTYNGVVEGVEVNRLFQLSEEALMAEAVAKHGSKRWFTKKSYFVDRRVEIICHHLKVAPSTVAQVLEEQNLAFGLREFAECVASEALGFAFGRWDIRFGTGEKQVPHRSDPFAALPTCSPGMLQDQTGAPLARQRDLEHASEESPYPIPVAWDGILIDDAGHHLDIEARIHQTFAVVLQQEAEAVEHELCDILGVASLRDYFAKPTGFFADHLGRYAKSRRQAPIYWPLSTRSGSYTLWLYFHRVNDQTLYTCVNDFVDDAKLKQVSESASQLRRKTARSSQDEADLERLTGLETELTEFRDEMLRIAKFWKPNLNDGVQITAAPLWKLFQHRPWQAKLKETWESLEQGEFDWAHLAMSIWPERVVPKCVADRSLAIAHDVEDLFWVEDNGRWRNAMEPEQEIEEQKRRQRTPARDHARGLIEKLADTKGDMSANAVAAQLSNGDWDDQPLALLLWPERVLEECWHNPVLADKHKVNLPNRRTQAAKSRLLKELVASGCHDLADQLVQAFDSDEPLSQVWHELAAGKRDHQPLALSLWPDRVIDKCTSDADLAEGHAVAKYFWVRHPTPAWRRRVAVKTEIANEIARRQGKPAAETN